MKLDRTFLILLLNLLISIMDVFSKQNITIEPKHYNIKLIPYIEDGIISGECNISISVYNRTLNISIYSEQLKIYRTEIVLFNDLQSMYKKDMVQTSRAWFQTGASNVSNFYFSKAITPGNYIVNIKFDSIIADNDGFRTFNKSEQEFRAWLFRTHLHRTGAQQMFPRLEASLLMATFNISVRHHKSYTILSNMPIRGKHTDNSEMVWTHFQTTPKMFPYHVAIVMLQHNFYPLFNTVQTVNVWYRPHTIEHIFFVLNTAEMIMHPYSKWKFLENFPKVDLVGILEFDEENTVIPGLIFYRENDIMYDEAQFIWQKKIEMAHLIGHRLVQQRFYNIFDTFLKTDLWLNNGFARFYGVYIIDKIFQKYPVMDLFVVQIQHNSLHLDINYNMTTFTSHANIYSQIPASLKAPCTIRMLQHILTEEIFLDGIRTFSEEYINQNNLWSHMQTALDNSNQSIYKHNLHATWMKTWALSTHFPVLNVMSSYSNTENNIRRTMIKIWQVRAPNETVWWIPATYTTQESPDFLKTSPKDIEWLSPERPILYVNATGKTGWIIVNLQQTGYYRVNYDNRNWRELASYLDSEEYTKIHVLNRAQIIDDAFHFVLENQLDIIIFLNVIKYLSRETNYIAWYPMIRALQNMSPFFEFLEKKIAYIKERMQIILNMLLDNIKYEEQVDEDDLTKSLREEALKWACILGSSLCKTKATTKLQWHLEDSNRKLSSTWKEWTYCEGLMAAGITIWNEVLHKYGNDDNGDSVLEYLTCSENPDIIKRYLHILQARNILNISDHIHIKIFHIIITKHIKNNEVLKHILDNFTLIKPRHISILTTIIIIINHLYSEEHIQMVRMYVEKNLEKTLVPILKLEQTKLHLGEILKKTAEVAEVVGEPYLSYILFKNDRLLAKLIKKTAEAAEVIRELYLSYIFLKIKIRLTQIERQKEYLNILI